MPLYDAKCACGAVTEIVRTYENRDVPEPCGCGKQMQRTFLPSRVISDIAGYESPIDGKWIGSRSAHRDHMKRHGVFELGNEKPPQISKDIPRESIRREIHQNLERMKSEGTWRER